VKIIEHCRRHFWVINAVAVMLCAFFGAKTAAHLVESGYLQDAKIAPPLLVALTGPVRSHIKDGSQLVQRNMFCDECAPLLDPQDASPRATSAALWLVATNVSENPRRSFASIANRETQAQGGYRVGEIVPGAGTVKEIHYRYVTFDRAGRIERLLLAESGAGGPIERATAPIEPTDEIGAAIEAGIKKVEDNRYDVDRVLVDKILGNPTAFTKGLRAVPSMVDGKINGFKLYAITPQSAPARLGLVNGDTLQVINGFELTSLDRAFEVYAKLREASSLELSLTRRGKPITLKVSIH
jgi:general secretion pathway protein C